MNTMLLWITIKGIVQESKSTGLGICGVWKNIDESSPFALAVFLNSGAKVGMSEHMWL